MEDDQSDYTTADYASEFGSDYEDAQTGYDTADNGTVATNTVTGSTTYTPPSWLTSLTNFASAAAPIVSQAKNLASGTTAPSPAATAQVAPSKTIYIIIGVVIVAILGVVMFLRRK